MNAPASAAEPVRPELQHRVFYKFSRAVTRGYFRLWNRLSCEGAENVPAEGPVVAAANHVSYLDPFAFGAFFPRAVHFMMMRTYYEPWYFRWFCKLADTIPVDRDAVQDFGAVKGALRHLHKGRVVGIFPEGHRSRSGRLANLSPGVAMLAIRSGAPVVPVHIHGTAASLGRGMAFPRPCPIRIRIAPPIASAGHDRASLMDALRAVLERMERESETAASPAVSV